MPYKQGDVVIVPFPFTNLSGTKNRPAVIVSNRGVNNSSDVILAQITTQSIYGQYGVTISNTDVTTPFRPPHTSMNIYCKKIAVIEKSLIKNKITSLTDQKLTELLQAVRSLFTKD